MFRWTVGSFHFHRLLEARRRHCLQDYWCLLHLLGQYTYHSPSYTRSYSTYWHLTFSNTIIDKSFLNFHYGLPYSLLRFHSQYLPFPDFQILRLILYWKQCLRFDLVYMNRYWDSEKLYFKCCFGWNGFDYSLVNLNFTFFVVQRRFRLVDELILGHTQL